MSTFNESFYTTDFDQQMMDFIESKYEIENPELEWTTTHSTLAHGSGLDSFWTEDINTPNDYSEQGYTLLTKQQFKEKIGMPVDKSATEKKTFTKKDLVDGMFVKTRNCGTYLKLGELLLQGEGFLYLDDYDENLIDIRDVDKGFDIIEVLTPNKPTNLNTYLGGYNSDSIWKRTTPKSEKVLKLEKLIKLHEEQLEAANKLLAEELNNV